MLTVEDIRGAAQLNMADERMRIPQAHAVSDNIDVGAKALIDGEQRNGVIYLRYKKLDALLKIRDGKKNLDIIKPLEKFEAYELTR
jgi:hypothetical protein